MDKRKVVILIVGLVLIGGVVTLAVTGAGRTNNANQQASDKVEAAAPTPDKTEVVASGRVVAATQAKVGFTTGGKIAEILVKVGDQVEPGQVVARLDSDQPRFSVAQAEARLKTAQARLDEARAGLRPEELSALDAQVSAAKAQVDAAQAQLDQARASLARLVAPPTELDLQEAQRRVDQAKDALWGAQAQRDAIGGQAQRGSGELEAAEARVKQSEVEVRLAEIALEKLQAGPTRQDIAEAKARVAQAEANLAAAQADYDRTLANADQQKAGARSESIAVFEAQVREAQVSLDQARAELADTELKAPFAASVAELLANPGEAVNAGSPVVNLMDLAGMQVETTDLQEYDVARLKVGQPVKINVLAVPDKTFNGKLLRISPVAKILDNGDATYKVTLTLDETDPRVNLGMTTKVEFPLQ
jgi:HlyD family secretion protein